MLSIEQKATGRKSLILILLMIALSLWVVLGFSSFFLHFLYRGVSEKPAIAISSLIWLLVLFSIFTFVNRDDYSGWSMVYYGRMEQFGSGLSGVLKMVFCVIAFSLLMGFMGSGILAVPTVLFANSHGSADFRVTDISYFRGSITHKYQIDVTGNVFSGQFLSPDSDPALANVHITNNINSHDIDCLHISYRYWYFGAIVDSLQNCEKQVTTNEVGRPISG